ncbi:hypothetical protein HS088_TW11G00154 [Tripterygium wilfordii]|uniref:Transmembrane protein n=1 Tax=Tripterygium wilfordii TaxID=458696 RepID=A0A7J7D189_TRIWF|nr:probable pectin methylesterase CGR2 [Tripterygium wilfordii]KAF5740090.1 hypothetical protein HS088_TW11G00154 [Tripterygium wilfordii]
MSRRPGNPARRYADGGLYSSKSRSSPLLSVGLIVLGGVLVILYLSRGSGGIRSKEALSQVEGDFSCTSEVQRAIPVLKEAYGDRMRKILHVGPDTCSVVFKLLDEKEIEAWGVDPYDIEDADNHCKALVQRGFVRVADIKFPLPYKPNSFSHIIVSDALDYLSPKYLNKTLPDFARVSSDGIIIFTGYPRQQKNKVADVSKFGRAAKLRSSTWWERFFGQTSLVENQHAAKKFEEVATKNSYTPKCQIFHLTISRLK